MCDMSYYRDARFNKIDEPRHLVYCKRRRSESQLRRIGRFVIRIYSFKEGS